MTYAAHAVEKTGFSLGTRELVAVGALSSAAVLAFSGDAFFATGLTALGIGLLLAPGESVREARREETVVYDAKSKSPRFYP
ncbi:MAG: hypothetical protein V1817_01200 [Candidatus Micrarchaeota archaeon]